MWPWNDITTRRFQGNRSICLQIDGAEALYDGSHHTCQNPICQQLKWQHICQDLLSTTLFAAEIRHECVRGFAALDWRRNTSSEINPWLSTPKDSATSTHSKHVTLACQNNLCWRTQCDMLSVWDYWQNGEFNHHIINSLECSQSFMTLCFIALDLRAAMKRL